MKDKALTDIEDKIKNDFAAGNFNIGDATDPNSVAGMAMAFLKGVASAAQESSKVDLAKPDLMTGIEALQALRGHYAVRSAPPDCSAACAAAKRATGTR